MHVFNSNIITSNKVVFHSSKIDIYVLHQRRGYPCNRIFNFICKIKNFSFESMNKDFFYHDCQLGRHKQNVFLISESKVSEPLELLYYDVWEPSPILSHKGFRYYTHFIDDYLRFIWIFLLRKKFEAKEIFC